LRLLLRGRLGRFWANLHKSLGLSAAELDPVDAATAYRRWRLVHGLDDAGRVAVQAQDASLTDPPRLSLLLPISGASPGLRAALASVLNQTYTHWELCVTDAGGMAAGVIAETARGDARVRYLSLAADAGPVTLANAALAQASGDHTALLDPADLLAPHALSRIAHLLVADRDLDLVYTDEDRLDAEGNHHEPFFKPDWSPEYLLSWHYTGRLSVYRTALVRDLGGFRAGFDGAESYDLTLRLAARTRRVGHVADVLYHGRSARSASVQAQDAARQALRDHLSETGRRGNVEPGPAPGLHRVRFAVGGCPRVSIIIATAGGPGRRAGQPSSAVAACVQGIRWMSTYATYEILVVNAGSMPDGLRRELDGFGVRHLTDTAGGHNRAATLNLGAAHAAGDHLVFLDEALQVLAPDWLECLLEYSQQADVGAVGAKLLFPNGPLPQACAKGYDDSPGQTFAGYPRQHRRSLPGLAVARNASAVTGACLMTRSEVFRAVGGFTEAFPRCFHDVDYCLKVQAAARRVVVTPYAQLAHPDPVAPTPFASEQEALLARWGPQTGRDPFSNPNLPLLEG
jgi:glycosyltransferase involved in cell wall biosynthesis